MAIQTRTQRISVPVIVFDDEFIAQIDDEPAEPDVNHPGGLDAGSLTLHDAYGNRLRFLENVLRQSELDDLIETIHYQLR